MGFWARLFGRKGGEPASATLSAALLKVQAGFGEAVALAKAAEEEGARIVAEATRLAQELERLKAELAATKATADSALAEARALRGQVAAGASFAAPVSAAPPVPAAAATATPPLPAMAAPALAAEAAPGPGTPAKTEILAVPFAAVGAAAPPASAPAPSGAPAAAPGRASSPAVAAHAEAGREKTQVHAVPDFLKEDGPRSPIVVIAAKDLETGSPIDAHAKTQVFEAPAFGEDAPAAPGAVAAGNAPAAAAPVPAAAAAGAPQPSTTGPAADVRTLKTETIPLERLSAGNADVRSARTEAVKTHDVDGSKKGG